MATLRRYPRKLSRIVVEVGDEVLEAWSGGWIQDEDQITERFVTLTEKRVNGLKIGNLRIRAKSYSGPGREEKVTGADFAIILEIDFDGFLLRKAFLAQAKKVTDVDAVRNRVLRKVLQDRNIKCQCRKMLDISTMSYVFAYTPGGIFVFPALEVHRLLECGDPRPRVYIHSKTVGAFYEEFFKTFIGDHYIADWVTDVKELRQFAERHEIRHVLHIRLTIETQESDAVAER